MALWGWGGEGRAAHGAIRRRLPGLPLTLFCSEQEASSAQSLGDALLAVDTEVDGDRLSAFDLVVKSPGISPYGEQARAAIAAGTQFIGGSTLWFDEHPSSRTICVTGTKGKSTTTALIAHLLRAAGHRTALAGNIGMPLLTLLDAELEPDYWAIELSSYQTLDVAAASCRPDVAVVLNLFPEHLDWHGSEARYIEDKLALVTDARPRVAILNAADARLANLVLPESEVHWFNRADGWHLRGDDLYRADDLVLDTTCVPLPGRHNRGNLCAVMAALEAAGVDATAMASHASTFTPLPNRLQTLGTRNGITYVNDSISTTPHASLAALECFASCRVAILLGGHDRGLDWSGFASCMASGAPEAVVTMGASGPRIHALLQPLAEARRFQLASAVDLPAAMARAREMLDGKGVILMSPGAPSYGQYTDYQARGRHFAKFAGFDPLVVGSIQGLGIA